MLSFEGEGETPIPIHIDGPVPFTITSQRVKVPAIKVHIRRGLRVVEHIEPIFKPCGVGWLNARLAAGSEELLNTSMTETFDRL